MNKLTLGQLYYLARYTKYRAAALQELQRREIPMQTNKPRFKNSAFQKVFEEGYILGREHGINNAPGIDPKTLEKIESMLGKENFR